jgi:hypothetical protein
MASQCATVQQGAVDLITGQQTTFLEVDASYASLGRYCRHDRPRSEAAAGDWQVGRLATCQVRVVQFPQMLHYG